MTAQETNKQESIIQIGKLTIDRNTLIFGNYMYQLANVACVWLVDKSYTIHHPVPTWIKGCAVLGFGLLLFAKAAGAAAAAAGVVLLIVAAVGYSRHSPETNIDSFALGIELNSGRRVFFPSDSARFVVDAANALRSSIASKGELPAPMVVNFNERQIHVGAANDATLVIGDVINSNLSMGS